MARKRSSSRRRRRGVAPAGPPVERPWAALFYLCGDHAALAAGMRRRLTEITKVGSSAHLYVAVQCDLPDGAVRFVAPDGGAASPDETLSLGAVNTGDPVQVIDFCLWAVRQCPARHVVLCFGGTGIACPESVIGNPQADPRRLFSICDDASARDALEVRELPRICAAVLPELPGARIDLVAFDMSEMQFLEVAFELHGAADVMLGYQTAAPEEGWPLRAVLNSWNELLADDPGADARRLATAAVRTIGATERARAGRDAATVSALDLSQFDHVTYAFDAMFLALMQALGDKILHRVRRQTLRDLKFRPTDDAFDLAQLLTTLAGHLRRFGGYTLASWYREQLKKLAERDEAAHQAVQQLVDSSPETDLESRLQSVFDRLPAAFRAEYRILQSEREHTEHLTRLVERALQFVSPGAAASGSAPFILARGPEGAPRCGLSIYRPRNLDRLMGSNYLDLHFHRRVHWTPLLAAVNLIDNHPRGLWRLVSSLIATTGGSAREDVLRRLSGPDSVVVGMRDQFRALARPPGVTLSLSPEDEVVDLPRSPGTDDCPHERRHYYRLRLESFRRGATVLDQQSRINPRTIDDTLDLLERLLRQSWLQSRDLERLKSLGRTLGEDIIQTVAPHLEEEHSELPPDDPEAALHLTLQIPRQMMRYPWELMHDGREFLCERYAVGRQVFMEVGLARRVPRRPSGAVRVLVIGDPRFRQEFVDRERQAGRDWRQLPGARNEALQVARVFERLKDELGAAIDFEPHRDVFVHQDFTREKLRHSLRTGRYDVIHFAGHAVYRADDPDQSAWMLSDGPLWALEIRNTLLHCDSPPWLVYANACESGMDSAAAPNRYHHNVFGLATAFINQGVAAYVGPLWPINDAVAMQIATSFYGELLLERTSLGEALRFAKRAARRNVLGDSGSPPPVGTLIGLSWAALLLYGDPTMRLMESLGTPYRGVEEGPPEHGQPSRPSETGPPQPAQARPHWEAGPVPPLQAPLAEVRGLVEGPGMQFVPAEAVRGTADLPLEAAALQLVEAGGVRYWQFIERPGAEPQSLPGSPVPSVLAEDPQVRGLLALERGLLDYVRVLGRWLIGREEGGLLLSLARQYDRNTVAEERLLLVRPDGTLVPLAPEGLTRSDGQPIVETDRLLLILHGTFSSTASPVAGLGTDFLRWAYERYAAVIGYDHWTLSRSPHENADELWAALDRASSRIHGRFRQGRRIDAITHSRGGLVARALVELAGRGAAIRNVVFVGTPNAGTDLANPKRWGRAADLLVNLVHVDPSGIYGRLSGLLARLAATRLGAKALEQIPGLWAQNPAAVGPKDFLGRLQKGNGPPAGVVYSAVSADYDPAPEINVAWLLKQAGNLAVDAFFDGQNDLVVNTSHVWAVDAPPRPDRLSDWWPADRLLVFTPPARPRGRHRLPKGVIEIRQAGVHHTNMFLLSATRDFLRKQLSGMTDGSESPHHAARRS